MLAGIEQCTGCSACADACPKKAIAMQADSEGFLRPVVSDVLCVHCGKCTQVCPIISKEDESEPEQSVTCFAARCKDEQIRKESSSGGIFSILALNVLVNNGVVYGAAFDEKQNVKHVRVDSKEKLELLRGSKYVQSDTAGIYKACLDDLKAGREVLFSGTPCQIAALSHFLGKDYDKLTRLEVICHGVPSPAVWQKYLEELEKDIPGRPTWKISSRNKFCSWRRYSMSIASNEGKQLLLEELYDNLYLKIFLHNLVLRPSCYGCQFKNGKSGADITLADFWGIERLKLRLDDDKGTSAVILHSEKAMQLWTSCSGEIEAEKCSLKDITDGNPAYSSSVPRPKKRDFFMSHFPNRSLRKVYEHAVSIPLYRRIVRKIRRMMTLVK